MTTKPSSIYSQGAAESSVELRLESVTFVRELQTVLRDVSFALQSGNKVGLVGPNGAGKTTLLDLVAGKLEPTEGRVVRLPGLRVAYAEQHTERWRGTVWTVAENALEEVQRLEATLRDAETRLEEVGLERYGELSALFEAAGGYEAETTLRATLGRLGFAETDLARDVLTLSGGERSRLALARALARRADLLLLDEPSSYLDLPAKRWLGDALGDYPGTLLLASHDRALLDAATTRTLHLKNGVVTSYRGSYSRFRTQAEHAAARSLREKTRLVHERRNLETRLREQPTLSTRRGLERRLARLPAPPTAQEAAKPSTLTLNVSQLKPSSLVLDAEHLTLTPLSQNGPLLRDVALRLYAGDKVALVGPNGSGKTSLLELLSGDLESEDPEASVRFGRGVKLAVYDQAGRGLEGGVPLGEQLERSVSELRARSLLALVGLASAFDTPPELLSGGQRARAGIARLMATEAELILLDEPGEGLDVEMLERLETALQDTAATLVLVSHDAALIDAVATRVVGLADGELKEYRGGLAGYYAGKLRLEPNLPTVPEPDTTDKPDPEAELEALEAETADVEARLADPLRLSERDKERLEQRLGELIQLRSERYEARVSAHLPAPAPRYRVLESGLTLTTNGVISGDATIIMQSSAGFDVRLYLDAATHIGHLRLAPAGDPCCLLPWAERALVRGAARLAFEIFGARALQLQGSEDADFSSSGFSPAGDDWWVQDREHYAAREGFVRSAQPAPPRPNRRRRRKRRRTASPKPHSSS